MLEIDQVTDNDGNVMVRVGDVIEARVVETSGKGGCVILRRTLGKGPDAYAGLEQAHEHGIPVEGVVTEVIKGGFEVQIAGARGFCPISQIDNHFVEDPEPYVGTRHEFRITRFERGRGNRVNLVVSRRALLEEEASRQAEETRAHLEVGAVMPGRVTSLKPYGAFVDLGGIEGMLHISELGHTRVEHPKDVLSEGQNVEVQVIKIEQTGDPKRPERIGLSLKSMTSDPWDEVADRFPEGMFLHGTVVRLQPFGAFVELAPGIEGLVHISELAAGKRINNPREVCREGDRVEVKILGIDQERRRISLSMSAAVEAADKAEEADRIEHYKPAAPKGLGTLGDLLKNKLDKK
jgi:small subunit ribosomal protein S1